MLPPYRRGPQAPDASPEQLQREHNRLLEENRRLLNGAPDLKKSEGLLRDGVVVRFAFIRDRKAAFPIEILCKVLKVSRGGFYAWSRLPPSPSAARRVGLVAAIRHAHIESRASCGR